jgi:hypothetical protein
VNSSTDTGSGSCIDDGGLATLFMNPLTAAEERADLRTREFRLDIRQR